MWIFSNSENTWVNLDKCVRLFRDGGAGWGFKSEDGQVTHVSDEEYNGIKEFLTKKRERPEHKDTIEELRKRLDALEKN